MQLFLYRVIALSQWFNVIVVGLVTPVTKCTPANGEYHNIARSVRKLYSNSIPLFVNFQYLQMHTIWLASNTTCFLQSFLPKIVLSSKCILALPKIVKCILVVAEVDVKQHLTRVRIDTSWQPNSIIFCTFCTLTVYLSP